MPDADESAYMKYGGWYVVYFRRDDRILAPKSYLDDVQMAHHEPFFKEIGVTNQKLTKKVV